MMISVASRSGTVCISDAICNGKSSQNAASEAWSSCAVADGPKPEIDKSEVLSSAAPNFVHFLDATHLIFTVLEANKEGIRDILCVHDSYSCLATRVPRLGRIIRAQFAALYTAWDPLRALHDANANDCSAPRLPELGNLNPLDVQDAEYPFM